METGVYFGRSSAWLAIACITSAVAVSPAAAQDADFSGFKVEGIAGYDNESADLDGDIDQFVDDNNGKGGLLYGIGAGYDFQSGQWVFGLEAELSESTAKRDIAALGAFPAQPLPRDMTVDIDYKAGGDFYIGGRVGYVVAPPAMLYLKGGYTRHKIAIEGDGTDNGVDFDFDDKIKLDGWRIGFGGEYLLSSGLFAKLEYRYSEYGNGDIDVANQTLENAIDGIDTHRHQVALGVGFRF